MQPYHWGRTLNLGQTTCGAKKHDLPARRVARARAAAPGRLDPVLERGGERPPDLVDVRGRPHGRADVEVPALRLRQPRGPAQRPPDLQQGPRVATAVCDVQGGGRDQRRRDADLPAVRQPDRGPPDAGPPVGRRGDRLPRPGPADQRRRRARRQAPGSASVPRVVPVRGLRDGRGLDVGGLRAGRIPRPRQPHRDHRRQPPRPDRPDDARVGPRCLPSPGQGLRLEGDRDRRT